MKGVCKVANNFNERLKEYREALKIKTKREMAHKIGISEQLYYMLENGSRDPSKDVLEKLFLLSKKPEEYWLYGISEDEYIEKREEFKCSRDAAYQLMKIGLLKSKEDYNNPTVQEVLSAALKADIFHLIEKSKNNK